mmetsp:Transcript_15011/g.60277  ORF Transcript_15011/g.60277 Transcript_15011/m.60277 type:complete len:133 (-) Transcript_15011:1339-1737(-)
MEAHALLAIGRRHANLRRPAPGVRRLDRLLRVSRPRPRLPVALTHVLLTRRLPPRDAALVIRDLARGPQAHVEARGYVRWDDVKPDDTLVAATGLYCGRLCRQDHRRWPRDAEAARRGGRGNVVVVVVVVQW